MKLILYPIVLFAAAAVASSFDSTACGAQDVVDTCLVTTQGYLTLCQNNDYDCLCNTYVSIVTCFNNCPNDPRSPSYSNQKQLYW